MRTMLRPLATLALLATLATPSLAQIEGGAAPPPRPSTLVKATAEAVKIVSGGHADVTVMLAIQPSWHINANPPSPDYMIPTVVTILPAGGLKGGKAKYPAPTQLKVSFDEQPLSVYTEFATITVPLEAGVSAPGGAVTLRGTVKYQACNDQVCTAPTVVPFTVAVTVTGGAATPPAGADTAPAPVAAAPESAASQPPADTTGASTVSPLTPPPGTTVSTAPAPSGDRWLDWVIDNVRRGGPLAIVLLFALGLLLNLTPCVYPMLGVTLSIFGSRGAAPTHKVIGAAVIYVLGIATMYSALGTAAALTGGLFGAFLQNPLVLVAIGALFLVLSLSMFGVYELNPPSWLLQRLGGSGTTGAIGLFLSGLVVGVFAAPCTGPPVLALLGLVATRGDAAYGFRTFFAFSLGLGAPYLVLAAFSNLMQRLPRSGDWMVWVKHLFGIAMVSFGLFYVLVGIAPQFARWVAPVGLLVGGLFLGFLDKSGERRAATAGKKPGNTFALFKRAVGVVGLAAGVWLVVAAPKQRLEFRPYDEAAVQRALAAGQPVILDFGADWCLPCHELDDQTFTDARVIAAAQRFAAFKVDLTVADKPEVIAHTKRFDIRGVPTVVFLTPGGEVRHARFSGFLAPAPFLKKLEQVREAAKQG